MCRRTERATTPETRSTGTGPSGAVESPGGSDSPIRGASKFDRSSSATRSPPRANRRAAAEPAGPAPITATSTTVIIRMDVPPPEPPPLDVREQIRSTHCLTFTISSPNAASRFSRSGEIAPSCIKQRIKSHQWETVPPRPARILRDVATTPHRCRQCLLARKRLAAPRHTTRSKTHPVYAGNASLRTCR